MDNPDDKDGAEAPEVDTTPKVSLTYHQTRGNVIPGVPGDINVDIQTYNEAYTSRVVSLQDFETQYQAANPQATVEEVQRAGSDHILERIALLEKIIAVNRLEWVMNWRVFEDRLKIASDAERTRLRKSDAERRRSNVEGPEKPTIAKVKARRVTHVPSSPEERNEIAVQLMMKNMGLTREEAMERLRMVSAIATASAPAEPVIPQVKVEEEAE